MSGVLYSKRNIELGYTLKRISRLFNIAITNVDRMSMLVYCIEHGLYNFIFVDCSTITVGDEFLEFVKTFRVREVCRIIFIGGDKKLEEKSDKFRCVEPDELMNKMSEIANSFICPTIDLEKQYVMSLSQINESIASYLIKIGITPKLLGFAYIKEIILYGLAEGGLYYSLSKDIYPMVASKNHTTVVNVERNIRNAINLATKTNGYKQELGHLLGDRPTNRSFLSYLVDKAQHFYDKKIYDENIG